MSFVDRFLTVLAENADRPLFTEMHGDKPLAYTGAMLAERVSAARGWLALAGVEPGDRVVLLAPNSAGWLAADVAILAQGAICVPMYARQDAAELVQMMHDCTPRAVVVADGALGDAVRAHWADAPLVELGALFGAPPIESAGATRAAELRPAVARGSEEPVTIIYTSGTSGEPKGVMLSAANVDHLLGVIRAAIGALMGPERTEHRVFHYLPFCFAGSRFVLWMCLDRANNIHASTDLNDLARELKAARPNYFLNVPTLLERIKNGVEGRIRQRGRAIQALYDLGRAAFFRQAAGQGRLGDGALLALAQRVLFARIRAQIGPELVCLLCGSAPLGEDTQRWFEMLGLPVYQVYGLTETTAIVTMDRPGGLLPGRVGHAIDGVTLRLGPDDELQLRGPNVFLGYWQRPEATAEAFVDGWFRTGDQAEIDAQGNVRIVGRVKNLLKPASGHYVAPEPIEQKIIETIEGVEQAVVVGHGRPFLTAIVTGAASREAVARGIEAVNTDLPHYRRVRAFHLTPTVFTPESGLLTANTKLRRAVIERHFAAELDALYAAGEPKSLRADERGAA